MKSLIMVAIIMVILGSTAVYAQDVYVDGRVTVDGKGATTVWSEVYRTRGKLIFPDVVRIESPNYQETEIGIGRELYSNGGLFVAGSVYMTTATGGQEWLQPLVTAIYEKGRLSCGITAMTYIPLNGNSCHLQVVDPAFVEYKLGKNKNWSIGVSASGSQFEQDSWVIKSGPMVRAYDKKGFWEFRATSTDSRTKDFWIRRSFKL